MPAPLRLLAISGSLRAASYNTRLLRASARLAPAGLAVCVYDGMGTLPLFNPDLEPAELPPVAGLREQVRACDGVIFASPEYAHGITGVLKNALDWLVSDEQFVGKPVALFNASPRSLHALPTLREVLLTMSAQLIEPACIAVPLQGSGLDENGILANAAISATVARALQAFGDAIRPQPSIFSETRR